MIRKTLTVLLLSATLPALAMAMPGEEHGGPGKRDGAPMMRELDLTREQQRQMRELMGAQMKKQHEITQRYLDKLPEAQRTAMQKELDASREDTHKAMRALLKPEQQKGFDEALKKMEERRQERAEFLEWKAERDAKQ